VILTPLGLLAPGTAWGEWSAKQLEGMGLALVPLGVRKWEGYWTGLLPDYAVPGLGENAGYLVSAVAGVALILMIYWILSWLGRREVKATATELE
jgi:cobalt/nickel transport system permease protein